MNKRIVIEDCETINGVYYVVRSVMPNKDDIKTIKNEVERLIKNDLQKLKENMKISA